MTAAPFLVLMTLLQQTPYPSASATVEELPSEGDTSTEDSAFTFRLALEAGPLSLPSGTPGGGQDIFALALPVARMTRGESFSLELGAPLRLRLLDADPKQQAQDYGGYLRLQDWDTTSDYGQVLRELRIGRENQTVAWFSAGPLLAFTLGEGRLVERYDNQLSPDYHPAGAQLTVNVKEVARVQVAASDVLSMRLFAGEVRLDIGRIVAQQDKHFDRYHAIASFAHDFGRVGEVSTESISAALLGGDAALYKSETGRLQLFASGGAGSRVDVGTPDIGGFAGFSIRGSTGHADISGRLEGRYQGGSFRFGLFGPSYELSRFSATGLREPPLAEERMDKNLAGFAELKIGLGSEDVPEEVYMSVSAAGEHFTIGRTDTDFTLALRFPGARTFATARVIVVGIGTQPRYSVHAELRHRILNWLYLWGAGGTVHFPQPDGSLVKGYTAGAGAGVDFSR
ncbi:MAG TPA: hypothetical protein VNA24_24400 [Hyalangium sp.]|jgi:hypothetical protein|nr:hypothetical protein [Hyalangium sp.]